VDGPEPWADDYVIPPSDPPRPDSSEPASPGPSESPAQRWVEAWRNGDDPQHAFHKLFEIYYRPLWRFFARRGFPGEDCHDLTQETFIRVYTGMDGFRGEARFETWLFRIATNTYRKSLRYGAAEKRAGQEVSLQEPEGGGLRNDAETACDPDFPGAAQAPEPLEDVLDRERRQALLAAVTELPSQMRRCVVLRVYQELAYKEIAAVMQVSIETVKAHLFQARKRLRGALADHFEDLEL
jgi:RNA polymerase sigma-70 factor (ECF subfamily)